MISRFSGVRLLGMVLSLQAARDTFTRPYFASVYCGVNIGLFNPSRIALLCSREGLTAYCRLRFLLCLSYDLGFLVPYFERP